MTDLKEPYLIKSQEVADAIAAIPGATVNIYPHFIGNGDRIVAHFLNDYGASIVRFNGSYGGASGLWELGVLQYYDSVGDYDLTYDTPITSDVEGHLTILDVVMICLKINKL